MLQQLLAIGEQLSTANFLRRTSARRSNLVTPKRVAKAPRYILLYECAVPGDRAATPALMERREIVTDYMVECDYSIEIEFDTGSETASSTARMEIAAASPQEAVDEAFRLLEERKGWVKNHRATVLTKQEYDCIITAEQPYRPLALRSPKRASRSSRRDAAAGRSSNTMPPTLCVLVLVSETDGVSALEFIGPFPSCQEAQAWHEEVWPTDTQYEDRLPWWVAPLGRPH